MTASPPLVQPAAFRSPVRVLLVDDSGVSRALMTRWIDESGRAIVVAVAGDGQGAVDALSRVEVDVVVLDVEMPGIDGIAAIPHLLAARPGVHILMASSLSERGAEITLHALRLGASDAIAKPRAGWAARGIADFREDLIERIAALGGTQSEPPPPLPAQIRRPAFTYDRAGGSAPPPRTIVIGASTGGPKALFHLIGSLPSGLSVPVLIAQHLPPRFTAVLARELDAQCAIRVLKGQDGMPVEPGIAYLGPGGRTLTVIGSPETPTLSVGEERDDNCQPSADDLMASAVAVWGSRVLGVVLSGMGNDSLEGARRIVDAGGAVIAQDHATATVWGMPGAVVRAGLAAQVLPLSAIGEEIATLVSAGFAESR